MRTSVPIKVIVYCPKTWEGKQELARRVADAHGDFVISAINKLNCPVKQKLELLQAVIDTAKGNYKPKEYNRSGEEANW
jgi:hypothetical protein